MSVRVAKSAGFCFGVSRAVELVEQAAKAGKKVVTLGPIIHNHHVVDKFRALGVEVIDTPEQACPGQTVIIRSHGVSRAVYEELQRRGVEIIDATCPFVKRIHGIVSRAEEEGQLPVIIGTPTHPEVEGIAGWCRDCRVFETLDDLKNWAYSKENLKNSSICMVSQTTLTESLWKMCGEFAKKQFTNLKIFDTICRATEYRQSEAAGLSEICQAMVVVGPQKFQHRPSCYDLPRTLRPGIPGGQCFRAAAGGFSRCQRCWNHCRCVDAGVDYKGGQQDYERNHEC